MVLIVICTQSGWQFSCVERRFIFIDFFDWTRALKLVMSCFAISFTHDLYISKKLLFIKFFIEKRAL